MKALNRLRSLALNFNNIGSIASTQKELLDIVDNFEDDLADEISSTEFLQDEVSSLNTIIEKMKEDFKAELEAYKSDISKLRKNPQDVKTLQTDPAKKEVTDSTLTKITK